MRGDLLTRTPPEAYGVKEAAADVGKFLVCLLPAQKRYPTPAMDVQLLLRMALAAMLLCAAAGAN